MLKVAIVAGSGDPLSGGGHTFVKTVLRGLAHTNLDSLQFELSFVISRQDRSSLIPDDFIIPTIEFSAIRASKNIFFNLILKPINSFHKKRLYKTLNSFDYIFYLGHQVLQTEIPYGFVLWDLQHLTDPIFPEVGGLGVWNSRELNSRVALRRASLIITGTKIGREQITKYYGVDQKHIEIIPHPVKYVGQIRKPRVFEESTIKNIFYPAQFWPHKNHIAIVEAAKILKESGMIDFKFTLCGSDKGNKDYILNRINQLGLNEHFDVCGFVPESELEAIYDRADALVYPSYSGPENLPPLEAISRNIPVLISNYPGASEQLGNLAMYFDPSDHHDLADKIRIFLAQPVNFLLSDSEIDLFLEKRTANYFASSLMSAIGRKINMRKTWC
jgi:glycosyltransferase involved in cell wall biosynthesis